MRARAIMVLGTGSHVGKSLLTAALCRICAQEGYRVAPFKSQNMSLNSAATPEGLEIGRAQALQAEAAGIAASVHMNPILIKPSGNMSSQIVVHGKIWGRLTASEYHQRRVEELMSFVRASYEKLASENEILILEGAGSPAEINLKQHDIANMRMAELSGAACLLIGDIDRGGVFASLLGTVALLDADEQARIQGFLINKFRGDLALLQPGITTMEQRLGKPCLGVIPYLPGLLLEEEDSLALTDLRGAETGWGPSADRARPLRIAVVALPSFSNFTDFDSLRSEPSVSLRFIRTSELLAHADVVVLPGSKQTVDDLAWMRHMGLVTAISSYARTGLLVGICGGMQMLGKSISDPHGMEHEGTVTGLGLLSLRTEMQPIKVSRLVSGETVTASLFGQSISALPLTGYEIHVGTSEMSTDTCHFSRLSAIGQPGETLLDGCVSNDARVFGTYLHGLFDGDEFRHAFVAAARAFHHLTPAVNFDNWKAKREQSFDRLAEAVRTSIDLPQLFKWIGLSYSGLSEAAKGSR